MNDISRHIYRLLAHGEIVLERDEFLDDDAVSWFIAAEGACFVVGQKYNAGVHQPARRCLKPNANNQPPA